MKILVLTKIFFLGLLVLAGAIVINALAGFLNFVTWYGFFNSASEKGIGAALQAISYPNLLFLFLIYPLLLGVIAYFSYRLFF